MRKAFFLILAVLLIFSSCNLINPVKKPSDIDTVAEINSSDIQSSGATNVPTTESEIVAIISGIGSNASSDQVIQDLGNSFAEKKLSAAKILKAAKSLSSSFQQQIDKIQQDFDNFPTTKKIDETISLSGENIGTYFALTTGEAAFSLNAVTTDGNPIDMQGASNLSSLAGEGTLKIAINPTSALSSLQADASAIKDFKFRLNAGGSASISTKAGAGMERIPDKITLDYAESMAIAFSARVDTNGGKFSFKIDSKYSGTIDYSNIQSATDPEEVLNTLVPSITITVKVYDDSGNVTFNKTYTSIEAFVAAFTPAT
ncbi:exported hypothetical protein [uncultured spirochete]|jgi:hypothetical protein|uniref:Lipoprotein n=1 Tax=uncultured spirochete TaxID=156406 RepID=A0A3P3XN08_9SPIR|nr:hypothetical protein [Rectinema subterraneum]SLM15959.1 exported hypothetical protein [uncultured spirochete]